MDSGEKQNKTRDTEYLEKELSHVCWLLHETQQDNDFLNDMLCKKNKSDEFKNLSKYLVEKVNMSGSPKTTRVWDSYYNGYWLHCKWANQDDWLWIGDSNKKIFRNNVKDIHWGRILRGKPSVQDYIWDDFYNGWWLYSEWENCIKGEWYWLS